MSVSSTNALETVRALLLGGLVGANLLSKWFWNRYVHVPVLWLSGLEACCLVLAFFAFRGRWWAKLGVLAIAFADILYLLAFALGSSEGGPPMSWPASRAFLLVLSLQSLFGLLYLVVAFIPTKLSEQANK